MGYASNRRQSKPADPKPAGKSPIDIADKYLDAFSRLAGFTNACAITLSLIAVLSWLFIIEPDHADIVRKKQAKTEIQKQAAIERRKQELTLFQFINDRENSKEEILENAFIGKRKDTVRQQHLNNSADNFVRLYEFAFGRTPERMARLNKALQFRPSDEKSRQRQERLAAERAQLMDSMIDVIRNHGVEIEAKFRKKDDSIENYFAALQKSRSEKLGGVNSGVKAVLFFTADPALGPVCTILFIASLVGFVFFQRVRGLRYLAKALRTYVEQRSWERLKSMHDLNVQSPFWIVPLPVKIEKVEPVEYAPIFGLRQYATDYVVLLVVCLLLLIGVQGRLLQLQMRDGSGQPDLLAVASFLLICATITISFVWLTNRNRTIALYNHEPAYDPSRRKAIVAMLALSIGGAIAYKYGAFSGFLTKQKRLGTLRRKKKRELFVSPALAGWYHNRQSGKYHYVDYRGYTPGLRYAQAKDIDIMARGEWEKVEDKQIMPGLGGKLAFGRRPWVMEQYALTLLGNGFWGAALDVLRHSAMRFPGNVRTFHLLKKIAQVHGDRTVPQGPFQAPQTIGEIVDGIYESVGRKEEIPEEPYLRTFRKMGGGRQPFAGRITRATFNRRAI